ncbi:MAG: type IV pili methyl-accepting chemotaxis transducer N-terminal domain-containing protein [Sulfuritalea sp.]|nr:type IV pili methyl-accepting chemotaxis transducer N-terminal domain-containing protein [Sulfuritalea sp.]
MPSDNDIARKNILKTLPLFAGLAQECLGELVRGSRSAAYQRGQVIYRPGDPASEIYVVLAGQVKLALSSNRGQEKVIDVMDAGRSFGEAELFGTHSHLAGAQAVKPTQLLCIAGECVRRVMALDPRVAERIINALAHRQIQMEAELAAGHFCSGSQRLLEFLLWLAGPDRPPSGETQMTLNISKRLLASRLDMQPETLSRALRDLAEAGLIAVDKYHISLRNTKIARYLADEPTARSIILPERLHLPHAKGDGYAVVSSAPGAVKRSGDIRPFCDAINKAGRQRMLSQRMAKSWLMLERGVMSRRARLILRQSADMFDSQMAELDALPGSAESRAAYSELRELWRPYRALLDSQPRRDTAHELFDMNESVLAAADKLTLGFEKAEGTLQGRLVNLAGRERMLSQRAAKFFMFRNMGIQVSRSRAELQRTDEEFSTALAELAAATRGQPKISDELQKVAQHWNNLQSAMTSHDRLSFAPTARKVFATSENLLQRMDAAVNLYAGLPG